MLREKAPGRWVGVRFTRISSVIAWSHTFSLSEEHNPLCRACFLRGALYLNTVCCGRVVSCTEVVLGLPVRDRDEIVFFDPS